MQKIEVVPAILRSTFEMIKEDWEKVEDAALHLQIDVTDGLFAGDPSFRDVVRFKQLRDSEKAELHMMVQTPADYVDAIVDLNPARCVFHLEAFEGKSSIKAVYQKLRENTQSELGLALNPESPAQWLEEHLDMLDFVLFMGYAPGWPNQELNETVVTKIGAFRDMHPEVRIGVDGHVNKETVEQFVKAGASILYANTALFGAGDPVENLKQLQLLAEAVV